MKKLSRPTEIIIGAIFLTLGILGLFLPILQGILFILIGSAFLSTHPTEGYLGYLKKKFLKKKKRR